MPRPLHALVLLATACGGPDDTADTGTLPAISWQPCTMYTQTDADQGECAVLDVPLDHDDPTLGEIP
ncbi:MAG: hypothetical protein EP330_23170 [Deltaproteobacteria bacterium]|nr:MAG: hypothetical protein EP330_23170 [Deltaproteobacteria bacterium]